MGSRLDTIHEFFLNLAGDRELNISDYDKSPMMLCYMIELYAHRNQYREDGTPYYEHPAQCADSFHTFYGFKVDNFDKDLLDELGLPFDGVGEVCLLLTGVDPFAVPSVTEEVTEVNETGLIHDIKLITSCLEYSVCHIKGIKEIIKGNGGSR